MKILILDDIQRRLDVFRAQYEAQGHEVVTVMKYSDCIAQLKSHQWDLVHLDHDLGEFVDDADFYLDGGDRLQFYTGGHVVQEIILRKMDGDPVPHQVIVHSINPRGAHMRDDLNRYGIPTTWEPYVDPGFNCEPLSEESRSMLNAGIESARSNPSVDLGSFAHYAVEEEEDD